MSFLVRAFLTLFVVIDQIGLLPIFITLTSKYSVARQARIARQAVLVAAVILLVFALAGNWLLRYLGISIEAFQVAAGILLLKIAVDMVFARAERETAEEQEEAQLRNDKHRDSKFLHSLINAIQGLQQISPIEKQALRGKIPPQTKRLCNYL